MNFWSKENRVVFSRRAAIGLVCLLLAVLYAALAFGIYTGLTQKQLGANDFFSRWMGARALFLRGQNPYDDSVTREIQIGMYGRLARADEDQVAFAYPLYAAFAAWPFAWLPYSAAQALWMALLVYCVVGGALALAVVNRIMLSPIAVALILLSVLFFYPSVRGIFLGQYALFSFGCIALACLAIATKHDTAAGLVLSISSVKPQPVVLLFPVILFWAWRNGRRRIVSSALLALAVLLDVSFVLVPGWLFDFINALRAYAQYARVSPPLQTFFQFWLPEPIATLCFIMASAVLGVGVIWVIWRDRAHGWSDFQPALGFVALVTTLIAGRIGTPDQIFLLVLWLAWLSSWCAREQRATVALGGVFLLVVPWFVFRQTLQGNNEAVVLTLVLPLGSLMVYLGLNIQRVLSRRTA